MGISLLTFGCAFFVGVILMPLVRWVSFRLGKVAKPREDRWHSRPTPTLGGIGIFVAFLLSLLIGTFLIKDLSQIRWGLIAGSGIVFFLGLFDDLHELTPPTKLLGQILAAAVVIGLGYTTSFFNPRIPNSILAQIPNILLTFIWLVGITNAINLLDNMDGLAGGISFIAAVILSYFFWRSGNQSLLFLSMALAGSLLAFLVFNFPPASIFMGDSGSLFIGFTLAVMAIARQPQASNVFAVLGVPTLLFLLPILDTTLVTFTRLLRGQSPAQGGRDHTSHRLIAFGLSERQAVLVLYGVALASGVVATVLESLDYDLSLVLVPLLILSLTLLTIYLARLKVVAAPQAPPRSGTFTRIIAELTYKRRVFEIILDFCLIGIAYYLALWTRSGLTISDERLVFFLRSLPIVIVGAFVSLWTFGVYRGVWRYISTDDLLRYAKAALGAVLLTAPIVLWRFQAGMNSAAVFILFGVYLLLGLAATRSSFKVLDAFSSRQSKQGEERVLICGAGDAGEMAARWILMNHQLGYQPVGFLDNDPFKIGKHIHGIAILGRYDQLETILENHPVDGIVLTADILNSDQAVRDVVAIAHTSGRWVRTLRWEFELVE